MSASRIRLICFDLGGVLVRTCRSWEEGCLAAGVKWRANGEVVRNGGADELIRLHQTGRIDLKTYAHRLSEALGGDCAPQELEAVHDAWLRGEYDGVGAVIDDLHAAGIATASLSNTSAEHWERLLAYPVIKRLKHRHASHLFGLVKPEPEIYRAFERAVGFAGVEILFFDDLPENVAAAREADWIAEHVDHATCTAQQIAAAARRHGIALEN